MGKTEINHWNAQNFEQVTGIFPMIKTTRFVRLKDAASAKT
ncbi:MAG: hypothetical protein RL215_9 [Planctomycetota bacterium]|jgi:hypothetical protein